MTLKEKIQEDFKKILKEKKEIEISTLRMLNAAILNREKEKRYKLSKEKPDLKEKDLEKESQLIDEETIEVIFSEVKKRKEAIVEFEKGKRLQPPLHPTRKKHISDLVEKEKKEMEILKKYLPELLSEEEIKKLAKEVIEKFGAKDFGRVMGQLMPKVKGKAEGGTVSKVVKELLGS
ncbi:GatB/YqeY domain-containing protein [Patescibacteria group bacterium]|nr:GatB/YqeY domain-containing protein [Patescibacteria group bacterium]